MVRERKREEEEEEEEREREIGMHTGSCHRKRTKFQRQTTQVHSKYCGIRTRPRKLIAKPDKSLCDFCAQASAKADSFAAMC